MSGFLYSYSYCPTADGESDKCIEDAWNYINSQCSLDLKEGWELDIINDCKSSRQICFEFESNSLAAGQPRSSTVDLGINSYCTIRVDASKFVGRITFIDSTSSLGVLYPGYVLGQPITVKEGETKYITVYNGNQVGVLTFKSVFSGAVKSTLVAISTLSLAIAS